MSIVLRAHSPENTPQIRSSVTCDLTDPEKKSYAFSSASRPHLCTGTLVHYYEGDASMGPPDVITLPASATGRVARISLKTLRLASQIRAKGTKLVLVSGTRYSTFATRLPFLPRADAYVIENGGRVFYPEEGKQRGKEVSGAEQGESGGGSGGDCYARKVTCSCGPGGNRYAGERSTMQCRDVCELVPLMDIPFTSEGVHHPCMWARASRGRILFLCHSEAVYVRLFEASRRRTRWRIGATVAGITFEKMCNPVSSRRLRKNGKKIMIGVVPIPKLVSAARFAKSFFFISRRFYRGVSNFLFYGVESAMRLLGPIHMESIRYTLSLTRFHRPTCVLSALYRLFSSNHMYSVKF